MAMIRQVLQVYATPQMVMNCDVAKLATVWVPYNPYIQYMVHSPT